MARARRYHKTPGQGLGDWQCVYEDKGQDRGEERGQEQGERLDRVEAVETAFPSLASPAIAPYRRNYTPAPPGIWMVERRDPGQCPPETPPAASARPTENARPASDGLGLDALPPEVLLAARQRGAERGLATRAAMHLVRQPAPEVLAASLAKGRRRRLSSPRARALAYLRQSGQALTSAQVVRATGEELSRSTVSSYFSSLVKHGYLVSFKGQDRQVRYCVPVPEAVPARAAEARP